MKKRFLQISVVVILLFSGLWTAMRHDGKEPVGARKASQYLIPTPEEKAELAALEPFFYINRKSPLSGKVMDYVEENLELFAYMDCNHLQIWGDETIPHPVYAEQPKIAAAHDGSGFYEYDYAVMDYDNDGEEELFYREKSPCLLEKVDGSYRQTSVPFEIGSGTPPSQIWFAEFNGKTVSFQLTGSGEEQGKALVASLCEGDRIIPVLSCQICFPQNLTEAFWLDMPLMKDEEEDEGRKEALEAKLAAERGAHRVYAGDTAVPEGLPELAKMDACAILNGGEWYFQDAYLQHLDAYAIDLDKDTESYQEDTHDTYRWNGWAYRWPSQDDTKEYLVSTRLYGRTWIMWHSVVDGRVVEHDPIFCSDGDAGRIISYGGRHYFVMLLRGGRRFGVRGIAILSLGMAGEWDKIEETAYLLEPQAGYYECIPIFGESLSELNGYVAGHFQDFVGTDLDNEVYCGENEVWEASPGELRLFKNISGGYAEQEAPGAYYRIDADNDGVKEYVKYKIYRSDNRTIFEIDCEVYRSGEGKFSQVSLEPVTGTWGGRIHYGQIWFEEIGDITYLFYLQGIEDSDDYLLHINVINGGSVEEVAAYLLKAGYREEIKASAG